MAKGIRELKGRIRGVTNIAKITRAMEMVATTKLKRLQERAEGSKPYAESLRTMVGRLADRVSPDEYPLLKKRDDGKVGLLAVSADKGLCGAYNSNVFKAIQAFARERTGQPIALFMFGARGEQYFRHRAPGVADAYDDAMEKIPFVRVRDVVKGLARRFLDGEVRELHLCSTRFLSTSRQVPQIRQLLPIDPVTLRGDEGGGGKPFIFEPSVESIFDRLLPKYLEVSVYGAILEALASEMAMKRAAMKAATDAANDMIGGLTRRFNRARQEGITNELLEIIGGAEALSG